MGSVQRRFLPLPAQTAINVASMACAGGTSVLSGSAAMRLRQAPQAASGCKTLETEKCARARRLQLKLRSGSGREPFRTAAIRAARPDPCELPAHQHTAWLCSARCCGAPYAIDAKSSETSRLRKGRHRRAQGMTRRQSRLLATTTLAATLLWLLIAPAQTSMELAGTRALVDDEIEVVYQAPASTPRGVLLILRLQPPRDGRLAEIRKMPGMHGSADRNQSRRRSSH